MSRPRIAEVRLVAALLSAPAEDVEELAAAVIAALDTARAAQESWCIRAEVVHGVYGIGPYPSRATAVRAAAKIRPDLETAGSVARMISPAEVERDTSTARKGRLCDRCKHPAAAHDWPRFKTSGCLVSGCGCGR